MTLTTAFATRSALTNPTARITDLEIDVVPGSRSRFEHRTVIADMRCFDPYGLRGWMTEDNLNVWDFVRFSPKAGTRPVLIVTTRDSSRLSYHSASFRPAWDETQTQIAQDAVDGGNLDLILHHHGIPGIGSLTEAVGDGFGTAAHVHFYGPGYYRDAKTQAAHDLSILSSSLPELGIDYAAWPNNATLNDQFRTGAAFVPVSAGKDMSSSVEEIVVLTAPKGVIEAHAYYVMRVPVA